MAQTTGAISFTNAKVEFSLNNSDWVDVSGFSSEIKPDGGEREIGEFYTLEGDVAILTTGKRGPMEISLTVVYTEGGGDIFEQVRDAYENNLPIYMRWSPKGGHIGDFQFVTDVAHITKGSYPGGEAKSGDPVALEIVLKTSKVSKEIVV